MADIITDDAFEAKVEAELAAQGDVLQKVRDVVTAWNWGPAMTDRDAMVAICQLVGDKHPETHCRALARSH